MKRSRTNVIDTVVNELIPKERESKEELRKLEILVKKARENRQEVVVVLGLGFVGIAMAAVVADTKDDAGCSIKFVIGVQRPSKRSYRKVATLNKGECPVRSEDQELEAMIHRCVMESQTLVATHVEAALSLADVVVVDVQCNYQKASLGNVQTGTADMLALEEAFKTIGQQVGANTLIVIETTVPPGTTEQIAYPIIKKAFAERGIRSEPLLAHSYERVMPGKNYIASIRDFWRVCSGVSETAKRRVVEFLSQVLNVREYPLTILDRPIESETAKIMENSYRATILAFVDEWSLFAERNGVDLKKVIEAIKIRPTHSNIMFPGPGIGGYCLPKDGALGAWANRHILGWEDSVFKLTPAAIDINDMRALHVPQLVRDALRNMNEPMAAADVLVLGVSYREDVGDSRNSGSELIVRRLTEMGANIRVHDPYVDSWEEIEAQPGSEHAQGLGHFFSRQESLRHLTVEKDMWACMRGVKAIVLAVRHKHYLDLDPDRVHEAVGGSFALIDCFCILQDDQIERYLAMGCEVKGMGRGHIRRIKERIRR